MQIHFSNCLFPSLFFFVVVPDSVTEVKTDIYVTSFGPVSDTDMVGATGWLPHWEGDFSCRHSGCVLPSSTDNLGKNGIFLNDKNMSKDPSCLSRHDCLIIIIIISQAKGSSVRVIYRDYFSGVLGLLETNC